MPRKKIRIDKSFPSQPFEMVKYLLSNSIDQLRKEGQAELFLPNPSEHSQDIVNRVEPVNVTNVMEEENDDEL